MEKWQVVFYADGEKLTEYFWVNPAYETACDNAREWADGCGLDMGPIVSVRLIEVA